MMADDKLLYELMTGVRAYVDGRYWWAFPVLITHRKRRALVPGAAALINT